MKTIFFLSNCSTCKRIISEVNFPEDIDWRDIKKHPIAKEELIELKNRLGSYEFIFSKKARNYKAYKGLELSESLMEELLMKDYTFLKRPLVLYDDFMSVGNEPKSITALKNKFT